MSNEKPSNNKPERKEGGASTQKLPPVRVDNPRDTARAKAKDAYQKEQGKKS
jgi:hypothetical protein